jgi:hypothetical protein
MMNSAYKIETDVTLLDWYRLHYEKSLRKYGPESAVTRGYKDILERVGNADIEEKTLEVHYFSDYRRPLDTSR